MSDSIFESAGRDAAEMDGGPSTTGSASAYESTTGGSVKMVPLDEANQQAVADLIKRNLGSFQEVGSVLASAFRRVCALAETYGDDGAAFMVAIESETGRVVGGAGIGPLAGLPQSEGLGEIRELVLEKEYRGKGYGKQLVKLCLREARRYDYKRIYLETTPKMLHAQRLFEKLGFRPVTQGPVAVQGNGESLPCYYLLDLI